MGDGERGFTLIEVAIAVAVAAIVLAAGGVWMLGMHPGALRNALNDVDANLAAARAIAAGSGNGATIVFLPRSGTPGFTMSVYAGRPNAPNAVTATSVMTLTSSAAIREATLGTPPFALFFSSAGYPTGAASYPNVASDGNVTFPVIATQPPCPPGGLVLTFTSPQGPTAQRTLPCDALTGATAAPDPSPTPNAPKVNPLFMVAHWTSDVGPLHFIAAEFGYTHWFASAIGDDCETSSSGTGAPPVTFASGWPYAPPNAASELTLAPSPPNAPYSWPNGDPNDPPAPFALQPSVHDGGLCVVRIVDDLGQEADAGVQVMGDLSGSASSLTFASPSAAAQTLTFGKSFDSEALELQATASACAGVASVTIPPPAAAQTAPSTTPTTATMILAPVAAGSCVLRVGDQYGEPTLSIPITVKAAVALQTWPQQLVLGSGGASVGTASNGQACNAKAETTSGGIDASLPAGVGNALGITIDASGCEVGADGTPLSTTSTPPMGMIAYNSGGVVATYGYVPNGCASVATLAGWETTDDAIQSLLGAQGSGPGMCAITFTGSGLSNASPAPGAGLVALDVDGCAYDASGGTGTGIVPIGGSCTFASFSSTDAVCIGTPGGPFQDIATASFSSTSTVTSGPYGRISGNPSAPTFTRTAPGPVTIYLSEIVYQGDSLHYTTVGGVETITCTPSQIYRYGPTAVVVN